MGRMKSITYNFRKSSVHSKNSGVLPDATESTQNTNNFGYNDYLYLVLLIINTIIMAILGTFVNRDFPDSESYTTIVQYFQGTAPLDSLKPPFSYRPLLPFMASLLPFDVETSFLLYNGFFLIVISFSFYFIALHFNIPKYAAFLSTSACMSTHTVLYYGTAILVDTPALAMMSLAALLMTKKQSNRTWISILLLISLGVAFKETAIVMALAYLLKSRDILRSIPMVVLPGSIYLIDRILFDPSGEIGYFWSLGSYNFEHLDATLLVFILGLMNQLPFVIIGIVGIWKKWCEDNGSLQWFGMMGISTLFILLFGLIFGYFSTRFIWPMYIALIPLIGLGIDLFITKLRGFIRPT